MIYNIKKISDLPCIEEVRRRSQALALLDAIFMPEWENRYFSFNCKWHPQLGEMMASMRDGEGTEYFLHFSNAGMIGKVFHESELKNVSLILEKIPDCFSNFVSEPAFDVERSTFFFFQRKGYQQWVALPDNLDSYDCLQYLRDGASCYHKWAEKYYGRNIDFRTLKEVFMSLSINQKQLNILNTELKINDLNKDIEEIFGIS